MLSLPPEVERLSNVPYFRRSDELLVEFSRFGKLYSRRVQPNKLALEKSHPEAGNAEEAIASLSRISLVLENGKCASSHAQAIAPLRKTRRIPRAPLFVAPCLPMTRTLRRRQRLRPPPAAGQGPPDRPMRALDVTEASPAQSHTSREQWVAPNVP